MLPVNMNQEIKMSSIEIASLTGKQHKDVMRDIRKIAQQLNELKFALVDYLDKKGEKRPMYDLDYQQTLILLTGYSIPLRAKVIARWQELEKPTPMTHMEITAQLANSLVQQERQITKLSEDVKAIQDKVNGYVDLDQLLKGYCSLHTAHIQYCNVVTRQIFDEFCQGYELPTERYNHVVDGVAYIVKARQCKIEHVLKLRDAIVQFAVKTSSQRWEHPKISSKFKLNQFF